MTRILLSFLLFLAFQAGLLANPGKNSTVNGSLSMSSLPSFQSITVKHDKSIIFWENTSTFGEDAPRFFLQQTNTAGELIWGKDVELSAGNKQIQSAHKMISDGSGGLIIVWEAKRPGGDDTDLYIQKIDSAGRKLWGEGGRLICTSPGSQITPFIIGDDAGGAFIAWSDSRTDPTYSNWDIYAQHVNSDGTKQWESEGVVISTDQKDEFIGSILPSGDGGLTIVWNMVVPDITGLDEGFDFYSKQLDAGGEWIPSMHSGRFLALPAGRVNYSLAAEILNDGAGGFFLSLVSNSPDKHSALYIQHVLSNGQSAFQEKGVFIESSVSDIQQLTYDTDSSGNYVITWLGRKDTSLLTCVSTLDRSGNALGDTAINTSRVPETYIASDKGDSLIINPVLHAALDSEKPLKSPHDNIENTDSAPASPSQKIAVGPQAVMAALTDPPKHEPVATGDQTSRREIRSVSVPVKTIEAAISSTKNYSLEYRTAARKSVSKPEIFLSQIIKNNTPAQYGFKVPGLVPELKSLHLLPD